MHNLPSNNETNIIRNIFNESAYIENARQQSLNEGPVGAAAKAAEKATAKAAEKAAAKAAKAAERAAAIAKAETVPMAPAPGLGEAGAQPRTINTGENITVGGEVRNVVRDPSTGQVTGTQPAPTGEPVRTKREPIEGTKRPTRTKTEPTEKELNYRKGGGTDPVSGERITVTDRSTRNAIIKYGAGGMGAVMAGGSIAAPFMVGGKEREYSTIEDRPVTPAPAPAATPASAPSDTNFVLPSGTTKTTNPYDIPSAKGPNKNLGGLAASYGLGTTDDVRARTQTAVDQLSKTFDDIVNVPTKPAAPVQTSAPASTRTPIMPGSSKEVIKAATSNPTADILKTIQDILTAPSAAPAKLPEQPMDRAVRQFKNREEEEKIARSTLSEPTKPAATKGAYESGQEVPEAEWKARQAKAQATYNDARAIKAGYRDYAHYQQMQDESAGLQKTAEAQKARLAELDKSNSAKLADLQAKAAASKKAADEADPVGAAMRRMINRNAGRPEDEELPADMQNRITNRTETGGVTSEPITDFSPEAQRKRTAARDQARFGTYQGVPKRDSGYGTMKPISEVYYRRLANLFEETSTNGLDINRAAYAKRGKGPAAVRSARASLANSSSGGAGDSTEEAPDLEPESTERPHIDTLVAPHIETLIRAAAKSEIGLSHGEAFDPRSKDHQRLIIKTKDPAVLKASEAIRQIRKDYGMED